MKRRKVAHAVEARECLAAVEASGQELRDWARANGVDARSLNAWRVNLDRRPAPRLVELVHAVAPAAALVLRVGRVEIEVPQDFDANHLGRVLAVLRAC